MTEDRTKLQWPQLAAAIRAARAARGLTQLALAELAGISEGSVQNLEDPDRRPSRIPQTLAKVEPHLGWGAGSALAILHGEDPIPSEAASSSAPSAASAHDRLRDRLPLRIVDELESDDALLDSAVIQLPGTHGARMTVVVHGNPDATPEEIQEALLAWRKTEQRLHRLPDGDDDNGGRPHAANGS